MDLFLNNGIKNLGITSVIVLVTIITVYSITKLIYGIIGMNYSFKIMSIPYEERIKEKRIIEYIVIILSFLEVIFTNLLSVVILYFFTTNNIMSFIIIRTIVKIFPIIIYLIINKRKIQAKGRAFFILSLLLFL